MFFHDSNSHRLHLLTLFTHSLILQLDPTTFSLLKSMEESGENWPSDSYLEVDDDVKDLCFDDEEFASEEDDGDSFPEMKNTDRKQRQQKLRERFLALSATIPGFQKMNEKKDKTSILDKASNYVRQLEQRVRELEQEVQSNKVCASSSSCYEVNSNGANAILPEVKVRVLQKEVLIIVHCEKQKGIVLKILSHLENINLSVLNSSVLRFGKSTIDITIIAQMGEGYQMGVDELVETLRLMILNQ
ncbi:transcription factor bHLH18 [Vigna radiata var. radiata]|uniref:Transcription factor bHLH18 n=1 Tax=Vigna radiata var. radiata TaxID=3916 RepID=A0A1S3VBF6_VIGRR|nr:transcription factor bHLH18 [Vigna radiata var. radiata]